MPLFRFTNRFNVRAKRTIDLECPNDQAAATLARQAAASIFKGETPECFADAPVQTEYEYEGADSLMVDALGPTKAPVREIATIEIAEPKPGAPTKLYWVSVCGQAAIDRTSCEVETTHFRDPLAYGRAVKRASSEHESRKIDSYTYGVVDLASLAEA